METSKELTVEQQALHILINACHLGQSKGAFTLEQAQIINQAITVFIPPTEPEEEKTADESAK